VETLCLANRQASIGRDWFPEKTWLQTIQARVSGQRRAKRGVFPRAPSRLRKCLSEARNGHLRLWSGLIGADSAKHPAPRHKQSYADQTGSCASAASRHRRTVITSNRSPVKIICLTRVLPLSASTRRYSRMSIQRVSPFESRITSITGKT
jgi:hypothetical protein